MASFNTLVAALLLSLSVVLSLAAAHTSIPAVPTPAPGPVSLEGQAKVSHYLKAHMTAAANKVELFIANEVEKRLNDPTISDSDKECLITCKEVYESAVDSMKEGTERVAQGDFLSANVKVSAFMADIDVCNECSNDFQMFYDWANVVGSDCLEKIARYSN